MTDHTEGFEPVIVLLPLNVEGHTVPDLNASEEIRVKRTKQCQHFFIVIIHVHDPVLWCGHSPKTQN